MTVEYSSFLIRLWRKGNTESGAAGKWCGEVEHIQTGHCWTLETVEALYSRDWPTLAALMYELLRNSPDEQTSEVCGSNDRRQR